jgi:hypothetical protein
MGQLVQAITHDCFWAKASLIQRMVFLFMAIASPPGNSLITRGDNSCISKKFGVSDPEDGVYTMS